MEKAQDSWDSFIQGTAYVSLHLMMGFCYHRYLNNAAKSKGPYSLHL